ncbi:MAG TPA: class II aldolase/adducin family protein [Ramlibacter sp.]|nr:class II aldolase/adducin family protein [Ramlibacter sp.]
MAADMPDETKLRHALVEASLELVARGFNRGTSGNIGVRCGARLLVTPSGVPARRLTPDSMVLVAPDGQVVGAGRPSSEWRFHHDILAARPDVHAVVHVHSPFATTLACLGLEVPPFHYMIAVAGGTTIRCAPYALFGTQDLSDHALAALRDRKACLLANHGMITLGRDLEDAMAVCTEVEGLCEQYWRARQLGEPRQLSDDQMRRVLEKFKTYGRQAPQQELP